MKKLSTLIFIVFVTFAYSQKKSNGLEQNKSSSIDISLAAGISTPSSSFSDNSYAGNGSFLEIASTYYFSKIGIGVLLGSISNPTEGNLLDIANDAGYPIEVNSEKWKTSYYGIGPSYKTNIGSLEAIIFAQAGSMSIKPNSLEGNFVTSTTEVPTSIPVYNFSNNKTSKVGFYNAGIKLGYKLNQNLGLYILANYASTFSDDLSIDKSSTNIKNFDLNRDGVISPEEIQKLQRVEIEYKTSTITSKFQTINYGFSLSYSFGKNKQAKAQDHNASRSNTTSSKIAQNPNDTDIVTDSIHRAQDHNASRSNTTSSKIAPNPNDTDVANDSIHRAQDHNASRSNTTSSKIAQNPNDIDIVTDSIHRAQDHNASRSNTTSVKLDLNSDDTNEENDSIHRAQDHNASRSNTTSSKIAQNPNDTDIVTDSIHRAQDHNASRSNTTSSKIAPNPNDTDIVTDSIHRAQDHNASRSNTTSSKIAQNPNDTDIVTDSIHRAQDHNASRSNTTSSKIAPNPNDTDIVTDSIHRAQDHNASRSNTTSSKIAPNPIDTDVANDSIHRAQDHNASRSNTTSSKIAPNPNDTDIVTDSIHRAQDHNASRSNTTSVKLDLNPDVTNEENDSIHRAQDHNASRSNTTSVKLDLNPDENNEAQKILGVYPKNNSVFKKANKIKKFSWSVIDTKILKPQFIIEITKIGSDQQPKHVFIKKTSHTSLSTKKIVKEKNLSNGKYSWKVTETTSGNTSGNMFFSIGN
jgi:hypothetical protein